MNKPKGGQGKKAPYESTHVRIPEPIKSKVEELKELFFNGTLEKHYEDIVNNAQLAEKYQNLLTGTSDKNVTLDDAKEEAKKILKHKKSAKESIAKLLTVIYGVELTKEDLD